VRSDATVCRCHTARLTAQLRQPVHHRKLNTRRPCRREARAEASQEPLLSSFYHASILSHDSFARSLAFVLANRLADATLLATELFEIFHSVLREHETLKQAALLDIVAFYERVRRCSD
jgi:serine O-acetyltransferase